MKCTPQTLIFDVNLKGEMRDCQKTCPFYYTWEGEIEGMVGKQEIPACHLISVFTLFREKEEEFQAREMTDIE